MKFFDFGLIGISRWIYNAILNSNFDTFRIHSTLKRKIIMRMNIILLLMISAFLQVSASTYAQKITLAKTNASLVDIFKEIQIQSGYDFIYSNRLISKAEKINIRVNEAPLLEVLKKCFEDQPFTYLIKNKTIVIKEREPSFHVQKEVISTLNLALDITGQVVDENGLPLAGVSITVKGSSIAAVTDGEGKYSIAIPGVEGVLVFSYIGFDSQEIELSESKTINITLLEKASALDEVVVIGYGSQSKELVSTAITNQGFLDFLMR